MHPFHRPESLFRAPKVTLDEKFPDAPQPPGKHSRAARERPGAVGRLVQEVWPDTLFIGQNPCSGPPNASLDEKSPNAPPTPGRRSRAARERPGAVGRLVQEVWPDTLFGGQIPVLSPKSDPRRKVPKRLADPGEALTGGP